MMGYTRTNEKRTESGDTSSWPVYIFYYSRSRTIRTWEIRGLSESYATKYCDTHADDTGKSLTSRRDGNSPAFIVEVSTDIQTDWNLDTYK